MQWLMLFVTLIVTALLHRVARAAPIEAQATLALGTLVLLAYIAGTIARRFRIPRLVGYLIAGWVAGPSWLGIAPDTALAALTPIATAALFLIACAAGNALPLQAGRGGTRRAVLRIASGAMLLPFLAVTIVVLTVSPWFPLTAHQPFRDALLIALTLGTASAVSSPVVIWPVLDDEAAAGSALSRTTLEVSVVQDFVTALLVVLLLVLAVPLGSRGTATPGVATRTLLLISGSIVAGITLALAAAQYLRVIRDQLAWVLVILALVASQAVRLLGLDAALMGLAAGIALRACAPDRARVTSELERCAIAVYVVFFSLTGATLRLEALNAIWPWILLLVGLRVTALWGAMRWAARSAAVSAAWAEYGWLGLVSQGGFAVTLAAIVRRAFPEWNVSLEALILAMIGVQLLAGPICFQWVLRRTGALTREVHDRTPPSSPEPPASPPGAGGVVLLGGGVQ